MHISLWISPSIHVMDRECGGDLVSGGGGSCVDTTLVGGVAVGIETETKLSTS